MDNRQQEGLTFDQPTHTYRLNGKKIDSVTQVMKLGGLIDDTWFTEFGKIRGTAVHEAVLFDIQCDLDLNSINEKIKGYVEGWFNFKRDSGISPIKELCEKRMYHPLYQYTGTPDIFCRLNGRYAVVDVKTGDTSTAAVQTAAYAEFPVLKGYVPDRFSLRLFPNAKYKLNHHNDRKDFLTFLQCLGMVKKT